MNDLIITLITIGASATTMGVSSNTLMGTWTASSKATHALLIVLVMCGFFLYIIIFNLSDLVTVYPDKPFDKLQWIPECNCSRPFFYSKSTNPSNGYWNWLFFTSAIERKNESSCSDEGTLYASNQNVIAFSLYFPPKHAPRNLKILYTAGVTTNLEKMRKFYPGYSMRVYTNTPLDQPWCRLLCNNSDLFWCNIENSPTLGNRFHMNFMTWRFLPLGDPSVDVFLSRDLDSVVTEREAAAVRDWLQLPEKKAIQLMRDKFTGHNAAVLGGMWGARNSYFGKGKNESVNSLLLDILTISNNTIFTTGKGFDQKILAVVMYKPRSNQIVAYDSYFCEEFSKQTLVRPFPIRRKNGETDFVGNPGLGQAKYELDKCPVACRPSYGKDWEFC